MPNRGAIAQLPTLHRFGLVARVLPLASMGVLRVRSEAFKIGGTIESNRSLTVAFIVEGAIRSVL